MADTDPDCMGEVLKQKSATFLQNIPFIAIVPWDCYEPKYFWILTSQNWKLYRRIRIWNKTESCIDGSGSGTDRTIPDAAKIPNQ